MSAASRGGLLIWSADLAALSSALEQAEVRFGLLSVSERAWPLDPPPATRRWRRLARIALRIALDRSSARGARGAEFAVDAHGKPRLPSGSIEFNVSHADHLALFAVAPSGPLGIDLERERQVALGLRRQEMVRAAAMALCESAPPGFLQAWTCLEALAKARGTGVGALLTDLGITAAGTRTLSDAEVAQSAARVLHGSPLVVKPLPMPPQLYAAIAGPAEIIGSAPRVRTMTAADCALTSL